MEIFVYIMMGGDKSQIAVKPLAKNGAEADALLAKFRTFDAAKARCFMPQDTHRLLGTIEGGFGSLASFSLAVRGMFEEAVCAKVGFTK